MDDNAKSRLAALDAKLKAKEVKDQTGRKVSAAGAKFSAYNVAYRVIIELFTAIAVGAAMGFGIDWLLGTEPWFLVIMTVFGFAAGIRLIMETAKEVQRIHTQQDKKESE